MDHNRRTCVCIVFAVVLSWNICQGQFFQRFAATYGGPQCEQYDNPSLTITFDGLECLKNVTNNIHFKHPDQDKSTIEIILSNSYNVTTHHVTSNDGYISTTYRITGSPLSPPRKGKQAVILFHGGGASGKTWLIQPGNRNLAFKLADEGYEVWLANARGTTPSLGHTHLKSDSDLQYWDFSIDEMAKNDLPLLINLILEETGTKKVHYVCHSMGCGVYLVALSELPELASKISAGVLLAPGAFVAHTYSPLRTLATVIRRPFETTLFRLLRGKVDNPEDLLASIGLSTEALCSLSAMRCGVCDNFLFSIYGFDAPQLNYTNLPNIVARLPDIFPMKVMFHFMQNIRSCSFRKYDYGARMNNILYGSYKPPSYNLSRVSTPTYIFYGDGDNLITPQDAAKTRDGLPASTVYGFYKVNWPMFNHIDFLMATDADKLVYNQILDILKKHDIQNDLLN